MEGQNKILSSTLLAAVTFDAVEMLAFRTKDIDGDVWCERVFLFKTQEEVRNFFREDNSILLDIFTEEDNRVLNNFEIHDGTLDGSITGVSFETEYAGEVRICEMNKGFVCKIADNK